MCGCEKYYVAYTVQQVAEVVAHSRSDGIATCTAKEVRVRPLTKTEGAVGYDVVTLDGTTLAEYYRKTGLAKLTENEKRALGL